MSLLTKSLLHNFCFKRASVQLYIFNKFELTCPKYNTFINKTNDQSKNQMNSLPKRQMFLLSSVNYLSLKIKLNEMLKDRFSFANRKYLGLLWFKSLDAIDVSKCFELLQMPDTFYSRFKIIELYVWMLLFHLPQGGRSNNLVRYGLIEAMWEDTEKRAKILESFNKNFRKNMKSLYEKFKISLILYDIGFLKNDMKLCNSLWYNLFDGKDIDPRILEVLISFIMEQMNHLQKLDLVMLTEKSVEKNGIWISIEPHYQKIFKNP